MVYNGEYNREMTFATDEPDSRPELNFELYAEQICRLAINATNGTEGAFTIGIFGSWGSGKTTLMRLIEKSVNTSKEAALKLEKGKPIEPKEEKHLQKFKTLSKCKTIWFNPWKYDGKDDLKNALIQTILREIADDENTEIEIRRKSLDAALRYAWCTTKILGIAARTTIKTTLKIDTEEIAREIEDVIRVAKVKKLEDLSGEESHKTTESDPYVFINKFEEIFRVIVEQYVRDGRLIIFIDDLDRCSPENALSVLESLKLYLDQANCIFFIGLDKRVIKQAVRQRYKDLDITEKEYIEKMIQLNFFIPSKDPKEVKRILQITLNGRYAENEEIWTMILHATRANVRKVKQFILAFNLIENIAEQTMKIELKHEKHKSIHQLLAKILLMQMNFPDCFEELQKSNLIKDVVINSIGKPNYNFKASFAEFQNLQIFFEDDYLVKFLMMGGDKEINLTPSEMDIVLNLSKTVLN